MDNESPDEHGCTVLEALTEAQFKADDNGWPPGVNEGSYSSITRLITVLGSHGPLSEHSGCIEWAH